MGFIVVIATMVVVSGVEAISIFTQDTTIEIVEMYSPAVTLHDPVPSPDFDCTGREDGSYASNCRSFYICKYSQMRRFWCSSGSYFDTVSHSCVSYGTVKCSNLTLWRKSEERCASDGIYPDYGNGCKSFYVCKNGIITNFTCPPGTKYDWRKGRCNPSYRVSCDLLTCLDKPNGVYQDVKGGCQRYYRCEDGMIEEFICPSGKIYDKRQSVCVNRASGAICSDVHFNCVDLPDGYYPDYNDGCRKFHLCIGGHFQSFYCPPGLAFSKRLLACDFSDRIDCQPVAPCTGQVDSVEADYRSECREFAVCENGTSIRSGICPQGKILDPVTSTCQPSSMVNCQPITDKQCEQKEDGIYTDVESDCTAYYLCVKQRVLVTSFCPEGSAFHVSAGKCLPSYLVSCGHVRSSSVHPCEDKIGLFPDFDTDCRQYHLCAYGLQKTFRCSEGFVFDIVSQQCRLANDTKCLPPTLQGTFSCLPGDDGYYPEVTDQCTSFHRCKRENGATYKCPVGQHYDPSRRSCSFRDSPCPPRPTNFSLAISVSQLVQWQFNCSGKSNGVYSSDQCEIFHICVDERIYSYACPPGNIFDRNLLLCRPGTCKPTGLVPWFQEQDFSCVDKEDSMYPDLSTHCRRYYICENGRSSTAYCLEGEAFDERTMTCVHAASINCTSSRPTEANTVSHVKPSGRKLPVRLPQKPEHPPFPAFRCPPGETGFFPDYVSGCRKFHICFRKLKKSYTCPSILLFNADTKSCDLPENVQCRRPSEVIHPIELNCTENPNVRIADRNTGCKKYYDCAGNNIVTRTCPEGTVYSEIEGRCDLQSKVFCSNSQGRSSHAHGIPNRYVFSCVNRADGFYPDFARDCHVFYRCVRGKKFSHYCKQGLLFDPSTGICQFEDTVVCSPPSTVEVT